jgi:dihydropteroate synthase
MGILNLTPDSFSDGGEYFRQEEKALERIEAMARDGADIIDVGGESTRPGSTGVSADEELARVIPVIREASKRARIPISIDTRKAEVAEEAIKSGASIVNDITGLRGDARMASVVARYGVGLVVMHMKGTPRTMQEKPTYENLIQEIIEGLRASLATARKGGIAEDRVAIDPGIGFGKTAQHNLEILNRLSEFRVLGKPLMVGVSRKSFIGKILNKDVKDCLTGTAAACAVAIMNGADIIRVHDVKEMAELARIVDAIMGKAER